MDGQVQHFDVVTAFGGKEIHLRSVHLRSGDVGAIEIEGEASLLPITVNHFSISGIDGYGLFGDRITGSGYYGYGISKRSIAQESDGKGMPIPRESCQLVLAECLFA